MISFEITTNQETQSFYNEVCLADLRMELEDIREAPDMELEGVSLIVQSTHEGLALDYSNKRYVGTEFYDRQQEWLSFIQDTGILDILGVMVTLGSDFRIRLNFGPHLPINAVLFLSKILRLNQESVAVRETALRFRSLGVPARGAIVLAHGGFLDRDYQFNSNGLEQFRLKREGYNSNHVLFDDPVYGPVNLDWESFFGSLNDGRMDEHPEEMGGLSDSFYSFTCPYRSVNMSETLNGRYIDSEVVKTIINPQMGGNSNE